MGIHPLRRALPFLAAATLVAAAPIAYGDATDAEVKEIAGNYLLWVSLGLVVLGLMRFVRGQRVQLRGEEREAQELARADALTGLPNRRAFDEALEAELARSSRAASTTSVALLDLDRFKEINDSHGHLDGDRCLREVGGAISRALRAGDRAFRWGGDEFALVLPDTDFEGAELAVTRIGAEVLNTCAAADGSSISLSWGIAETDDETDARELLGHADLALMTLKRDKLQA
jgi:diguanylate cyclase (GGDEF)-like protein